MIFLCPLTLLSTAQPLILQMAVAAILLDYRYLPYCLSAPDHHSFPTSLINIFRLIHPSPTWPFTFPLPYRFGLMDPLLHLYFLFPPSLHGMILLIPLPLAFPTLPRDTTLVSQVSAISEALPLPSTFIFCPISSSPSAKALTLQIPVRRVWLPFMTTGGDAVTPSLVQ